MEWLDLDNPGLLDTIRKASYERPQVIFKHSTRCSISHMALGRLNRSEHPGGSDFYLLDLIAHRAISNAIAETFQVYHESPQVLVIKNGACVYDESHSGIHFDEIVEAFQAS